MVEIINKFGVNWKIITAKTNELYIIENESFYNTCKKWFMLVQDKNNITQYLAYHNTTTEKNIITTHIKTSTYSSKQKLYEIDNIELNKDDNLRTDYDTIFTNKNLYAIPDNHIDIIEKIDPSLGKYIDRFKNDNITNCTVNNDLLRKIIIQYNHYRKSQFWTEQYKYDYFEQHNHIFDNLDNLEEKIKNLGSPNFVPFMWKTSIFRYLCKFHLSEFKNILVELFNEKEDLISRINLFLKNIKEILIHSPNWKSKDRINVGVESASFFLALKDPTKYLLYTRINPYNTFSKNLNINITTKNEDKYVQWIKYCNDILRPEMNKFLGFENNLLDCQDLIWWYHNVAQKNNSEDIAMDNNLKEQSLNQILYGPPGTGKTYNTVIKAIEITNPELIQKDKDGNVKNYEVLKGKFDELKQQGQIEFVTFHQSYSYEEFVEGIKPEIPKWNDEGSELKYVGKDGIFKNICEHAKPIKVSSIKHQPIDFSNTKVFKMSLGNTLKKEDDIYEYCISHDVVALGFKDVDFSDCKTSQDFKDKDKEDPWGATALERFVNWIDIGDIIIVSNGNRNFRAIAQVTGNYYYDRTTPIRYSHFRKVEWLYKGEDIYYSKINNKVFSQQSIYGYFDSSKKGTPDYNPDLNTQELNNIITGKVEKEIALPHILIIDEINRGNISKIFGELITLIEEDKRGTLSVKLPYSQEDFTVPQNLYIIGTMNTSDRSIASIDIALRRRFKFVEMMPKPEELVDKNNQPQMVEDINLQSLLKTINERISYLLDRDHQIGHSYFMNWDNYDMATLKDVWFDEIIPLLNEYFYSDWDKLQAILGGKNDNDKDDKKFFIIKLKKPDLAYNVDCSDEEVYYNFVKKEDVNETDFRTMLENAKLIEPKSNETSNAN